jgi:peptidoglycan glycosyltransferase
LTQTTWKDGSRRRQKKAYTGKAYVFASYLFLFLFVAMIAYMVYFQVNESEQLLQSPYNNRLTVQQKNTIRGALLANDGSILAQTVNDENGNEVRVYNYGSLFAQTVGYTDYGNAGLEATQNYILMDSSETILDHISGDLTDRKRQGDDIVTSLDVAMQTAAYNALGGQKGAVVVLDADTSKVLASVSLPDFDPNTVAEDWETLNLEDSGSPFLNRGLQGLYEPGSTFKIVTTLAYLNEFGNDADFHFNCTGEYTQGTYTIHCSGNTAHGEQTLADAFANSCNCAFSYMATELLDSDALAEAAASVKFNQDFSFGLPSSTSRYSLDKTTKDGLTMQTAIGQGDTLATPIHMAMIAQSVYNNGEMLLPSFINQVQNINGNVVKTQGVDSLGTVMSQNAVSYLKSYMRGVVERGTASGAFADVPVTVCGKTGTAEYQNNDGYVHSWFVGFTDTGDNDIVFAVIIEEATEGETTAAQVAANMLKEYYGQ